MSSSSSVSNVLAVNEDSVTGFSEASQEGSASHVTETNNVNTSLLGENSSDAQFPDTVNTSTRSDSKRDHEESSVKRAKI
jgi:hypothetical protein